MQLNFKDFSRIKIMPWQKQPGGRLHSPWHGSKRGIDRWVHANMCCAFTRPWPGPVSMTGNSITQSGWKVANNQYVEDGDTKIDTRIKRTHRALLLWPFHNRVLGGKKTTKFTLNLTNQRFVYHVHSLSIIQGQQQLHHIVNCFCKLRPQSTGKPTICN